MNTLVACEEGKAATKNSAIARTIANKAIPDGVAEVDISEDE